MTTNPSSPGVAFTDAERLDISARALPDASAHATLDDVDGGVLFGAGTVARVLLTHMMRAGKRPAWIVDSNPALWKTEVDGIPVRSPDSLMSVGDRMVLVASSDLSGMGRACLAAGVKRWAFWWHIQEVFGPWSVAMPVTELFDDPDISYVYGLLSHSPDSQKVFKKALTFRVTGDTRDLPPERPNQYFASDLVPMQVLRSFVDCGAYAGDTLEEWAAYTDEKLENREAHLFEPDPTNFTGLLQTRERLPAALRDRCHTYPMAVGAATRTIRLAQAQRGTVIVNEACDGLETGMTRLDDALSGRAVTTIKMDIEGFELDALEGARELVRLHRPALLIAVYHRYEHLWKVPLWIHQASPGYRLHLRHHSSNLGETVCYAIPEAP